MAKQVEPEVTKKPRKTLPGAMQAMVKVQRYLDGIPARDRRWVLSSLSDLYEQQEEVHPANIGEGLFSRPAA